HDLIEGARHQKLALLREGHHTLRDVDAVADDIVLAVDVLRQIYRPEVDSHAHRQLADVVEDGDGGEQRPLRIVEERDGGAVAGIDEHALARLYVGELACEDFVEALLQLYLLADAELRIAGDIEK